jgi:hypothetical protein
MVPYYYTIPMIDGIYKVNRLLFDHCQILICNIDPVPTKIYGFRGMFNLNGMNALFGRFYNYPVVRGCPARAGFASVHATFWLGSGPCIPE